VADSIFSRLNDDENYGDMDLDDVRNNKRPGTAGPILDEDIENEKKVLDKSLIYSNIYVYFVLDFIMVSIIKRGNAPPPSRGNSRQTGNQKGKPYTPLRNKRISLELREDPERGMVIAGLTEHVCTSMDEYISLIVAGNKRRMMASTERFNFFNIYYFFFFYFFFFLCK
jgi:hypothetical protein